MDQPANASLTGKQPRIQVLVVDDDVRLARVLQINLHARGFAVTVAHDGQSALALAGQRNPQLVILDLGLPDLDGIHVLSRLRRRSTVPVIVLSARSDTADKILALDTGADDYITKPFGIAELMARVGAALRNR